MKIRNAQLTASSPIRGLMEVHDGKELLTVYVEEENVDRFTLTWDRTPPAHADDLVQEHIYRYWKE